MGFYLLFCSIFCGKCLYYFLFQERSHQSIFFQYFSATYLSKILEDGGLTPLPLSPRTRFIICSKLDEKQGGGAYMEKSSIPHCRQNIFVSIFGSSNMYFGLVVSFFFIF